MHNSSKVWAVADPLEMRATSIPRESAAGGGAGFGQEVEEVAEYSAPVGSRKGRNRRTLVFS